MLFIYQAISLVLGLAAMPFVLLGAALSPRWRQGLAQRLGAVERGPATDRVLVHLASVGEVISARAFVNALMESLGRGRLVISTMTPTGNDAAKKAFPSLDVVFFPADFAYVPRRWLRRLGVCRVILFETELWPLFLLTCRADRIPVAVVNGRISDKSFPRYKALSLLVKPLLSRLAVVAAQNETYRVRLLALGIQDDRCVVTGNLKLESGSVAAPPAEFADFMARFTKGRRLLIFASTHDPEEAAVLSCLKMILKKYPDAAALIAPRHKERFEAVWRSVVQAFPDAGRRSGNSSPSARVLLLDTHGELSSAFAFGYATFMGGSLAPVGGHNVLEPARHGLPVAVGPHTQNFRAETDLLARVGALTVVYDTNGLLSLLDSWLAGPALVKKMGDAARRAVMDNQGSLSKTLDLLASRGFLR